MNQYHTMTKYEFERILNLFDVCWKVSHQMNCKHVWRGTRDEITGMQTVCNVMGADDEMRDFLQLLWGIATEHMNDCKNDYYTEQ